MDSSKLSKALDDLVFIRAAVERLDSGSEQLLTRQGRTLNLKIQGTAFLAALTVLVSELMTGGVNTTTFLYAAHDRSLMLQGLGTTAVGLLVGVAALYGMLWFSANKEDEPYERFLRRNFAAIANFSLASDLLVKFLLFSLLIFTGRTDWVAPLLMLFTADYLLQGRFFTLPLRVRAPLGLAILGGSILQWWIGLASVTPPLVIFCLVIGASCIALYHGLRSDSSTEGCHE